ncbi:U4/U6 small nuclear ribonucleoprotein PRP4-like protein [Tanacetum coccineum]
MTAKVWSSTDFKPVKVLSGHKSKVTSVDVAVHGQNVATVLYDRAIKLCEQQEEQEKEVKLLVKVYNARPCRLILSVVTFVLIGTFALTGFLLAKGDTKSRHDLKFKKHYSHSFGYIVSAVSLSYATLTGGY